MIYIVGGVIQIVRGEDQSRNMFS